MPIFFVFHSRIEWIRLFSRGKRAADHFWEVAFVIKTGGVCQDLWDEFAHRHGSSDGHLGRWTHFHSWHWKDRPQKKDSTQPCREIRNATSFWQSSGKSQGCCFLCSTFSSLLHYLLRRWKDQDVFSSHLFVVSSLFLFFFLVVAKRRPATFFSRPDNGIIPFTFDACQDASVTKSTKRQRQIVNVQSMVATHN